MHNNASPAKRLALAGILIALAFAFSYLEHLVPIQLLIPVPGIKLGLSNVVTMFALVYLDKKTAFAILIVRCFLQTFLFGTVSGLLFSLGGGILSFACMALMFYRYNRWFSLYGISIAGAACHHIGQLVFACVYFQTVAILSYLPVLLLLSIPLGALTAFCGMLVFRPLQKLHFISHIHKNE